MLLVGANDQANKEHHVLLAEIECVEQNYSILVEQFVLQAEQFQSAGWGIKVLRIPVFQPVERTFSS